MCMVYRVVLQTLCPEPLHTKYRPNWLSSIISVLEQSKQHIIVLELCTIGSIQRRGNIEAGWADIEQWYRVGSQFILSTKYFLYSIESRIVTDGWFWAIFHKLITLLKYAKLIQSNCKIPQILFSEPLWIASLSVKSAVLQWAFSARNRLQVAQLSQKVRVMLRASSVQ